MFYRYTIGEIETVLQAVGYEAKESPTAEPTPEHVLWMCGELWQLDDTSRHNAAKAGRWIGWMLAVVEINFGHVWTNETSRQLIREDVQAGYDVIRLYR